MTDYEGKTEGSDGSKAERVIQRAHVVAALLGFVVFFLLSVSLFPAGTPAVEQPFPFNHRIHTMENDMTCTECHVFYEKETFSGLPDRETCAFCHEEALGASEQEAALVELLGSGAPLDWKRLFRQPSHVFYSHRRHVNVAGLECETCHGDIGQSESPPRRVRQLDMDSCLDCHVEEAASEDCTACHR